ncbi:tRNA (adenine22-N1)-methyltransferase [Clostridium cavendishii DSM 21758]|uniref:tRNA (Adenine22-N1)-methyltransferase n=1 Tax=Clostridium cavendishii DSM 21758 TaxID=1121302 RepID=A0A1M6AKM4_9CLOT|nr:class I SAM-dependent methyltransferase [Clostridium cavendishii]SHI36967.1 tRNA (adenine22-N1)-methyltransferase [Clostridium cavendishii DSM 21758]
MELSIRLKSIVNQVDKCNVLIDVGTDHGYVPIELVKAGVCNKAIASDINKGPIEKAKLNIAFEGLNKKIECRLGGGLSTVKKGEVNAVIIAGMGGNLTRDILLQDIEKVKLYDFLILQPAQNPEVLRKFLYNSNFDIVDEDLILEDNKYYELFKVKYNKDALGINFEDKIDYEISPILREKNHQLINSYINSKIEKYENILKYIKEDSESANIRKQALINNIEKLKEMI